MKKKLAIGASKLLALVAVLFVSTASLWIMHRPEIPEELQK
ncbi:cyclic lactone autoinducer peptide [Paenibacillus cisolokensis]|nr:cyclic lactone autoinducer peptide [Paenibacillus sp. 32O-W]